MGDCNQAIRRLKVEARNAEQRFGSRDVRHGRVEQTPTTKSTSKSTKRMLSAFVGLGKSLNLSCYFGQEFVLSFYKRSCKYDTIADIQR